MPSLAPTNPAPPRSPAQSYYERSKTTPSTGASRLSSAFDPSPPTFRPTSPDTDAERRATAWKAFHKPAMPNEPDTRHRTLRRILLRGMQKAPVWAKATLRQERERLVTSETGSFRTLKTSSYATQRSRFSSSPTPETKTPLLLLLRRFSCSSAAPSAPLQPPIQQSNPTAARKPDALRDLQGLYGEDVPFTEGNPRITSPYAQHSSELTYFSREFMRQPSSSQDATPLNRNADRLRPEPTFPQKPLPRARSN